jgi:23S rRNA (adenine2503-C2)-methyltransferase
MKSIYSLSLEELNAEMAALNQTTYRAKQIYRWLYQKNARSFDDMTDIAKAFREILKSHYSFELPVASHVEASRDGTVKALFRLEDGQEVEGVLMHYVYGYSVCVSSEVGCNMGCSFCASGLLKKKRNLLPHEMMGQVLAYERYLQKKDPSLHVSHVVIMGTGEPFDNYDNVMSFIRSLNCPFGFDMGARHITVSTCGIVPMIQKFGKEGLQVNLAISLHAPRNELRDKLMPINKAYPLEKLIPAVIDYEKNTNRQVTFEYILIQDVNDTPREATELFNLIAPTHGFVNLIPYNPVMENGFQRSPDDHVSYFQDYLLSHGVKSTIRKEFGSDIDAACGQLRAKYGKQQ